MTAAIHSYALDWFWICHTRKHFLKVQKEGNVRRYIKYIVNS